MPSLLAGTQAGGTTNSIAGVYARLFLSLTT